MIDQQLLTIFWRTLSQIQANQLNLLTFKNQPINNVEWSTCDKNNKSMHSYFYERKKLLGSLIKKETCQLEKKENGENIFLKLLLIDFG